MTGLFSAHVFWGHIQKVGGTRRENYRGEEFKNTAPVKEVKEQVGFACKNEG